MLLDFWNSHTLNLHLMNLWILNLNLWNRTLNFEPAELEPWTLNLEPARFNQKVQKHKLHPYASLIALPFHFGCVLNLWTLNLEPKRFKVQVQWPKIIKPALVEFELWTWTRTLNFLKRFKVQVQMIIVLLGCHRKIYITFYWELRFL